MCVKTNKNTNDYCRLMVNKITINNVKSDCYKTI